MPTASDLLRRADKIEGYYKSLRAREESLVADIEAAKAQLDVLSKSSAVLKHLLDVMVKDEINRMAALVTYGLKTVFDDQDLSFVPVISKKNERMNIDLKTKNRGLEGDYDSFGGSVAVIESFLLRVLCMLKKNLARLMLFDETFAPVGSDYIPNTSKLLSELSKKLGIDILLVTHQKGFLDGADHAYRVSAPEPDAGLVMEKLK